MKAQTETEVRERAGKRVQLLRKSKGWTQQKLADVSGLPRSYLADLEGGRRNPSLRSLIRVANALSVELAELFADPPAGPPAG